MNPFKISVVQCKCWAVLRPGGKSLSLMAFWNWKSVRAEQNRWKLRGAPREGWVGNLRDADAERIAFHPYSVTVDDSLNMSATFIKSL